MKLSRCLFPTIVGLMFLSLLVLGMPVSGFTQVPHTCKQDLSAHQPSNLGNVTSFHFYWAKDCPSSNTIQWNFQVFDGTTNALICRLPDSSPQTLINLPPYIQDLSCTGLPKGLPAKIKVIINYTVPPGSPMVHTENFINR